ncbi:MAG: hypothetical protein M1831_006434 [Alyxoria varia]|nr:MAG: hypothetical protein M1831_006434 [Alyxoria varia]
MRFQHLSLVLALSALTSAFRTASSLSATTNDDNHAFLFPRGFINVPALQRADADLRKLHDPKLEKWLYNPSHKFANIHDITALQKYVAKKQTRLLKASEHTKEPKYAQEIQRMTEAWGTQQPKMKGLREDRDEFEKLSREVDGQIEKAKGAKPKDDTENNKKKEPEKKKKERVEKKRKEEAEKKKKKQKAERKKKKQEAEKKRKEEEKRKKEDKAAFAKGEKKEEKSQHWEWFRPEPQDTDARTKAQPKPGDPKFRKPGIEDNL